MCSPSLESQHTVTDSIVHRQPQARNAESPQQHQASSNMTLLRGPLMLHCCHTLSKSHLPQWGPIWDCHIAENSSTYLGILDWHCWASLVAWHCRVSLLNWRCWDPSSLFFAAPVWSTAWKDGRNIRHSSTWDVRQPPGPRQCHLADEPRPPRLDYSSYAAPDSRHAMT
jgi:hypothetical protein